MRNGFGHIAGLCLVAAVGLGASTMPLPALDQASTAVPKAQLGATPFETFLIGSEKMRSGDMEATVEALELAAESGVEAAVWQLGNMYATGNGVVEDDRRAFELFQKLANDHAQDNPRGPYARLISDAFIRLGAYYADGIPDALTRNPARAMGLYRHAAVYFGDPEAQYRLALLLLDGSDIKPDPRSAVRWLDLAADEGHVESQAILGQLFWLGEKVPRRPVEGLSWLMIAREGAAGAEQEWIDELLSSAVAAADENTLKRSTAILDAWRAAHGITVPAQPES